MTQHEKKVETRCHLTTMCGCQRIVTMPGAPQQEIWMPLYRPPTSTYNDMTLAMTLVPRRTERRFTRQPHMEESQTATRTSLIYDAYYFEAES